MAKVVKTHLFCLDDHKSFSEDVKKRFSDPAKYLVSVCHNSEDYIKYLNKESDRNYYRVAILGVHDSKENLEMIDHLILEIKKMDHETGIIILSPPDKIDEVKKSTRINVDSCIPRNANTVLRIHNTIKKLISEHNLLICRKRRNFSFYVLFVFLFISLLFALISYFRLPMYF